MIKPNKKLALEIARFEKWKDEFMATYRAMQLGDKFVNDRLGLVEVYSIESNHTIVVVDLKGKYFRMSGLSVNYREALKIELCQE